MSDATNRAPLDYCSAHLGTDLYSTDGQCDQAGMFSTPCDFLALFFRTKENEQQT